MRFSELTENATITYRLPKSAQPVDPDRLWHGRITNAYDRTDEVLVAVLDAGYEDLHEMVSLAQIVAVEAVEAQEPAMRYCKFCGQHHYVAAGEFFCPLKPT